MALSKETKIDQITVTENGVILIREAIRVMEDGAELSKQYHRTSLLPGQDISDQPQNIQDICNIAWTPDVIAAYEENQHKLMPIA